MATDGPQEVPVVSAELDANASNLTGRDAATTEGLVLTYSSLLLMALLPILFGSLRSVVYHCNLKKKGEEASDRIDTKEAAMFPLYASVALFGLYLFLKYVPKEYLNLLLSVLFLGLGASALARACCNIVDPYLPSFVLSRITKYHLKLTTVSPNEKKEENELDFSSFDIVVAIACALLATCYFLSTNWVLNNILGLAFCLNTIELVSLESVGVGCILLGGLFFYDIFWVFGTDVMVTVAKSFEVPIKLVFPMDLLENGLAAKNFGMLGLGDIVVPGLFIALLCRFDFSHRPGQSRLYFYTGFLAYVLGLALTIAVMHCFRAAQPALLYLVPSCLGMPLLLAAIKGDLKPLFGYNDYPAKEEQESKKD